MTMRQRIESEIEPTEVYETIVKTLIAESSKPVTTRLAAKVEAALAKIKQPCVGVDYEVRLIRFAGMTNLEWGGYSRSHGNKGGSILISHTTKSEPIAERYLTDMENHLAAKRTRNEQRRKLLASKVPEKIDAELAMIRASVDRLNKVMHDDSTLWNVLPGTNRLLEDLFEDG